MFDVLACRGAGGGGAGGSGDAHASLEPQASTLLRVENVEACGSGSGGEVCAGWERLKALFEA